MIVVKHFSLLIAFVMVFACLSTAYADVALPPRPRNVQSDFVTADIDDGGKLTLKFAFPAACDYEYHLIDRWEDSKKEIHHDEVKSGKGSYKVGDVVETVVELNSRLRGGKNYFVLKVQMSNIKKKTIFGTKTMRDKKEIAKTIVISLGSWNRIYDLHVYKGDID